MAKNTATPQKKQAVNQTRNTAAHKVNDTNSFKLYLFIVFIVPFLLYMQTVSFGYSGFDDDLILVNNSQFFSHISNMTHAFTTDALTTKQSLFYRPVQTISYLFDVLIQGIGKTWMFHFSNILLMGLIGSALFLLLLKFRISPKLALFGTLLYSVHPLFVSTIAWIPARGDLQLTLFSLLSLLFFIEYQEKGKMLHLVLHFVTFAIALFCKETAAMLPVLFVLYLFCFTDKKLFDKKQLLHYLVYALIGIEWFWMRSQAIASVDKQEDQVGISSISSMIKTIPESLAKFFVPLHIAPIPSFTLLNTCLGLLLIAAIVAVFIMVAKRTVKQSAFFLGWFLLFMAPTLFFKHTLIDYLDHRFLLPLIGVFLFILTAIPQSWTIFDNKKTAIVLVIIAALAVNTFLKTKAYTSPTTFYNEALAQNSQSCLIYYNRGCMNINNCGPLGQVDEYTKALALKPDYYIGYLNRGSAYSEAKLFDKAINDYAKAIALKPNDARGYYNRGYTYRRMHIDDKALSDYSKAVAIDSLFYKAVLNRASTYFFFRQYDKAVSDYTKAIALQPDSVTPYYFRALAFEQLHDNDKAIADYTKAIALTPANSELYFNRGNMYNGKGMPDNALEDYTKAISINPNHGNALNNRALTYYGKGMNDLACKDFARAEQLGIAAAQSNRAKLCK